MAETTMCAQCAEPVAPGERFCEACGFDLGVRRGGTATAVRSEPSCHGCGRVGAGEYCPDCGLRYRDGTDRVETDLVALAGVSDRGHVHPRNEDALALGLLGVDGSAELLGAVVCDGVSSTRCSELAARDAAETALDVLLRERSGHGAGGEVRVRDGVAAAARAVAALATPAADDPSCTIVAAFVDFSDPADPEIAVGWLGDSRAYWLAEPAAAEPARMLTADHSWAAETLARRDVDEAAALSDPRAHMITRWLGADNTPDVRLLRPRGPGTLLLCTDGLWNHAPAAADLAAVVDAAVVDAAAGADGGQADVEGSDGYALRRATALTSVALDAGAHDNVTAAVIPITPSPTTPRRRHERE